MRNYYVSLWHVNENFDNMRERNKMVPAWTDSRKNRKRRCTRVAFVFIRGN